MILSVGDTTIRGEPDRTRENTSAEGKASSVQFVRFPFTPEQKRAFAGSETPVTLGFDHPRYGHLAMMPSEIRQALTGDLQL
jgi:hypothetical protein